MCQIRRLGRWIKWFVATSDSGIEEENPVNDGPQRKMAEERKSLKYAEGIP